METQENVSLKGKTTMRIGGLARYYADLQAKDELVEAIAFAKEKKLPLIVLGGGSNTIFDDGTIEALVVRIKAQKTTVDGNTVTVEAGKNLPELINDLAKLGLDLSPLTGILGTVGGAVFGNAGQGPKGIWIGSFVESVTAFVDGEWKTFSRDECHFRYRESHFKDYSLTAHRSSLVLWEATLHIPSRPREEIEKDIQTLLQKRIETQPHVKTAGSCFKAVGETPAWKLIDAAGLRGKKVGGVKISEKHTNFLINDGDATFADAAAIVEETKDIVKEPLEVEMRFVGTDGSLRF